jgi:Sulfotransferase family
MAVQVADEADRLRQSPLFICGVGRSGTSYLLALLNATSKLHLSFEGRMLKEGIALYARLKQPVTVESFSDFLDQLVAAESDTHGTRGNMPLITVVQANRRRLYATWLKHHSYAELMAEIYALAFGQPIWGDKLLRIEYVWSIIKMWPEARFIILYRDPRAVSASQKLKWGFGPRITAGYWNTHFNLSRHLCQEISDRVCLVHYEQLITRPHESLESLLQFASPGLSVETSRALEQHPPSGLSVSKWRQILSNAEIEKVEGLCYHGMVALGYQPEKAAGPMRLSKTGYLWDLLRLSKAQLKRPAAISRKRLWERLRIMLANAGNQKA